MQKTRGMSNLLTYRWETAYETEPLWVQHRKGTRVVAKRPDGSSITRTTAYFKKVPFRSIEEAHRWSSAELPAKPVNESPPSTGEDGFPGLELTDGSVIQMGACESIPTDAALPAGLTSPLARDQGPRRSERHRKDTDTGKVSRLSAIMLKLDSCCTSRMDFRH